MDPIAIFTIIEKGLTLIPLLLNAGSEIGTIVNDLTALTKAGATGTVTDVQLADLEARFDAQLTDFNTPMPAAAGSTAP